MLPAVLSSGPALRRCGAQPVVTILHQIRTCAHTPNQHQTRTSNAPAYDRKPRTFVYNDRMRMLTSNQKFTLAKFVYDDMIVDGVLPTVRTFHCLLINASQSKAKPEILENILADMRSRGFAVDAFSYTLYLSSLLEHRQFLRLLQTFDDIQKLGVETTPKMYSCVVEAYCQSGLVDEAQEMLRAMQLKGNQPTEEMFAALIKGCGVIGDKTMAFKVFDDMAIARVPATNLAYNALFGAIQNDFASMVETYNHMKQHNILANSIIMNTLLKSAIQNKKWEHAMVFVHDILCVHKLVHSRPLLNTILFVPLSVEAATFLEMALREYLPKIIEWRKINTRHLQFSAYYHRAFADVSKFESTHPGLLDAMWDVIRAEDIPPTTAARDLYTETLEARLAKLETQSPEREGLLARLEDVKNVPTAKPGPEILSRRQSSASASNTAGEDSNADEKSSTEDNQPADLELPPEETDDDKKA